MPMIFWAQIICQIILTAIAIGSILYKTGRMIQVINDLNKRSDKIESRIDGIEKYLPQLIDRPECSDRHREITLAICKKIDDLQHVVETIDSKREATKNLNDDRWNQIFQELGRLQGIRE